MLVTLNNLQISDSRKYNLKDKAKSCNLKYDYNPKGKSLETNLCDYGFSQKYYNTNLDGNKPLIEDPSILINVLDNPKSLNNLKLFFNQRARQELEILKQKEVLSNEDKEKIEGLSQITQAFPSVSDFQNNNLISFSGNSLSKEDKKFCHTVIHSASALCGALSAAMGEGAAVGADTPFLWGAQGAMFLALQNRFDISHIDHAFYIARQLMMGQVIGVSGAKILISWIGIGGHTASVGGASGPVTAAVRGVNCALSAGITEKMGWGYVSSYENDSMKWRKQALQTGIYMMGAELFGKMPDTLFDTLDSENVQTALDAIPEKTLSTYGKILKTLTDNIHIDRFGFLFGSNLAQNVLFSKNKLNKDELGVIVSTSLLNTVIYDLLDWRYEQTITDEATETIKAMSKELQSNPEVFREFTSARDEILEKLNINKAGTQEFVDQFKNKKFVYDIAMISSELSREVANKYRKRNFANLAKENQDIKDGSQNARKHTQRIIEKLTPQEQEELNANIQEIINNYKDKNIKIARSNFGLEQIGGYEKIKTSLIQQYSIPLELEKKGIAVEFPNIVLFYGPSGTGKTAIGQAIAQETGSKFIKKNAIANNPEKMLNWFNSNIQGAREAYKSSGRRTIIQLNEFGKINTDNKTFSEIIEFMSNCSKEHYITLFLTTNDPLDINKEIMNLINKNNKLPMGAAQRKDIEEILRYYIGEKEIQSLNYNGLTEELAKVQPKVAYSNSQIREMIESLPNGLEIEQQDIISYIRNTEPQIKNDMLEKFNLEKNKLNKESENEN